MTACTRRNPRWSMPEFDKSIGILQADRSNLTGQPVVFRAILDKL